MRATTQRRELLEALSKVKTAVPTKPSLPVLASVLIKADGGQITLTGNDLEVCLTGGCKANISKKGSVCAPVKGMEAFLKAVNAEKVTLSLSGKNRLKIEADTALTTLEGFEAQDYPSVPKVKAKITEVIGMGKALKEISYAMAKEDSRPVLNAVCLAQENGKMEMAAADGFRLAVTSAKAKGKLDKQIIVPSKAVRLIERLMPGKVAIHNAQATPEGFAFASEGLVMAVMPIQGSYPNYQQLIPKNETSLKVDCKELSNALRVVAVTLPDNNAVRLQTRTGKLIVSTKADEQETEVKVPTKGKIKIAFDIKFLKDTLARMGEVVTIRTKDAQSPAVFRQNGTVHVLMPMHVWGDKK